MKVSIIILTKDNKEILTKTIPVLLTQEYEGLYEIIVVDSGSTDGAVEYLKTTSVKLIQISPNEFHFAKVLNKVISAVDSEFIIKLGGDAQPTSGRFISELLEPFKNPNIGATFGKYTISNREGFKYPRWWPAERFPEKRICYSVEVSPIPFIKIGPLHIGNKMKKDKETLLAGGCSAFRTEILKERSFNEKVYYGEDAEYAWFLHLIGYDIEYTPYAEVLHEHPIYKDEEKPFYVFKYIFVLYLNIYSYWLLRVIGIDLYKKFKNK